MVKPNADDKMVARTLRILRMSIPGHRTCPYCGEKPSSSLRTARSVGFHASARLETLTLCELRPQALRVRIFAEICRSSHALSTQRYRSTLPCGRDSRMQCQHLLCPPELSMRRHRNDSYRFSSPNLRRAMCFNSRGSERSGNKCEGE